MSAPAVPSVPPTAPAGPEAGARRGQWVAFPHAVVFDNEAYEPIDTNVYGKVDALSQRGMCVASVAKICGFLGISKGAGERSLRRLNRPRADGVTEAFTKRRTHQVSGNGQTAERWTRKLKRGEPFVWGPVLAADTLSGPCHRLSLALRHAQRVGHQPTLAELALLLGVTERTVCRYLDQLAAAGWITVDRRAGYRGRHQITVHDHPVRPVDEPAATPDTGDGSGGDLGDGSLASKEDQELNDSVKAHERLPSRRRRDTGSRAVDNPARDTASPPYTGPGLQLSPRVWAVLAPVRYLLPAISPYLLRRAARDIGQQLDTYADPERLYARVQARHNTVAGGEIRDPGAWLLGAALPRHGCAHDDCEGGTRWSNGRRCEMCDEQRADRRTGHPPHPRPAWPDGYAPPPPALPPTGT